MKRTAIALVTGLFFAFPACAVKETPRDMQAYLGKAIDAVIHDFGEADVVYEEAKGLRHFYWKVDGEKSSPEFYPEGSTKRYIRMPDYLDPEAVLPEIKMAAGCYWRFVARFHNGNKAGEAQGWIVETVTPPERGCARP